MANVEFTELLEVVRQHISEHHRDALNSPEHYNQVKPLITSYLRKHGLFVENVETTEVVDLLYAEMVENSFLTPYLKREDVEEININSWDDVVVSYSNGTHEKIRSFFSPTHAEDVLKRLLQQSNSIVDEAIPLAEGHLHNNARIAVMKKPLVDAETSVAASIRLLHPSRVGVEHLIEGGNATSDMIRFLCCCMRYGVSFVVAGATSSGKTTLLNALLKEMPDEKRIFTIEAGSRELKLVRRDDAGKVKNNIVHTLAKKADKEKENITMERLVVASLRFDPDLIVVGEMRDEEAYAAIDASLTGHTLVSTIHSFAGAEAHMRLATLCQKRFPMALEVSLMQAAKAFPVVCFEKKLEDGSRKITNITECEVDDMGRRTYHTLFRYVVDSNEVIDGKLVVHGHFEAVESMSDNLRERMKMFGIPSELLAKIDGREE